MDTPYPFAAAQLNAALCFVNLAILPVIVADKVERVTNFHRNTLKALAEFIAASGLSHPAELEPRHIYLREGNRSVLPATQAFRWLEPGELLTSQDCPGYGGYWRIADAKTFFLA